MTHRLLLGSGSLITTLAQSLDEQPGTLLVATSERAIVESLQEQSIEAIHLESVDVSSLEQLDTPDLVGVFGETEAQSYQLTSTVKEAFPNTTVVAYQPQDHESEHPQAVRGDDGLLLEEDLSTVADRVIDPTAAVVDHITDRVGDNGRRMRQLQGVLRSIDNLGVIAHDNPDPDAIASGVALVRLAEAAGCEAELCYYGEITHQENRAFVNVLDLDLRNLDPDEELDTFDGIALVDHSRPGVNDQLPEDIPIDIVIDHHPPRSPIDAKFVDLRSNVGATSTLLVDYLDRFNYSFEENIATALLFGIHVDTKGFSREISEADFHAGARLVEAANFGMLERIESPSINSQTFETIARAISYRRVEGDVLISCVGELAERDALAQAADRLLTLEGISIVLVSGIRDGQIFISARARGTEVDVGEALRDGFGQIGSAGGHVDMAGAQIELGMLEAVEDRDESLRRIVKEVVESRFLDVLEAGSGTPLGTSYSTEAELDAEYLGKSNDES